MTTAQIQRRLGITTESALRLKRRIQVFASTHIEQMQKRLYEVLAQTFEGFDLPKDTEADLSELSREVPIPQADTVVLYSCSQRANKGRKRYKRKGQTSSIYRSQSLGGEQMGTLVNTFGIRQGPAFFDSISDQKMNTLNPLIRKYMPHNTPIFTDMGYRAFTGKNHRMVNHNARSKDKRYKFARNRWSKKGVNCNVAEGLNALVKQSFTAYRWINPKYSQLYLNEFAFIRNLKHFDILELIEQKKEAVPHKYQGRAQENRTNPAAHHRASQKPLPAASERAPAVRGLNKEMMSAQASYRISDQVRQWEFEALTLIEIQELNSKAKQEAAQSKLEAEPNPLLRARLQKLQDTRSCWIESRPTKDQRRKQRAFEVLAEKVWEALPQESYLEFRELADQLEISTRSFFRILPVLQGHGLIEMRSLNRDTRSKHGKSYDIRRIGTVLVPILYVMPKEMGHRFARIWENQIASVK
ncbi:transposase [Turneriella parva]|uniref:transposase n=1 Tax=Turneriella parva TaxID=29510 RepID=UPI0012F6D7B0|nr:transposase [Turneriella parva]